MLHSNTYLLNKERHSSKELRLECAVRDLLQSPAANSRIATLLTYDRELQHSSISTFSFPLYVYHRAQLLEAWLNNPQDNSSITFRLLIDILEHILSLRNSLQIMVCTKSLSRVSWLMFLLSCSHYLLSFSMDSVFIRYIRNLVPKCCAPLNDMRPYASLGLHI